MEVLYHRAAVGAVSVDSLRYGYCFLAFKKHLQVHFLWVGITGAFSLFFIFEFLVYLFETKNRRKAVF